MKKITLLIISALAVAGCMRNDLQPNHLSANALSAAALTDSDYWIICCNQASEKIEIYNPAVYSWNDASALEHSWYPNASDGFTNPTDGWDLPSDARLRQIGTQQYMGVCCSEGFCAEIPYPALTGKLWAIDLGSAANPHAIELLPNGNVAIAEDGINRVTVYAASQGTYDTDSVSFGLNAAHGVLWDPGINELWVVGNVITHTDSAVLTALIVGGTAAHPTLTEDVSRRVELPGYGGHDLQPYYGNTNQLWVSMNEDSAGTGGVYIFNKTTKLFTPAPNGANRNSVKSISNEPDGQIVETRPTGTGSCYSWTTDTVNFYADAATRIVTGACFYKARVFWYAYQ